MLLRQPSAPSRKTPWTLVELESTLPRLLPVDPGWKATASHNAEKAGNGLSLAGLDHMYQAPWLAIWPAVALSPAVFGFNMLGDALRDVLDPRLRGTGTGPAR